jgi:hypothetical protein
MIVDYLNICGTLGCPAETNAPLLIDADAPQTAQIPFQRFQPVARRGTQIIEPGRGIEHIELARRHRLEGSPFRWTNAMPKEQLGRTIRETNDHKP